MAVESDKRTGPPGEPDLALALRAQAGDRLAFAQLVERNYDFVYRIAYRWCGRRADAEDIAQEVCAKLGSAIRSFRGGSSLSSWLYSVTMNAARDWGRGRAREANRLAAFAREAETADWGKADAGDDQAERLWAAVRELPHQTREAVTLVYGEGLNHAAAAALMGCSESTVSWHVHDAKKRLKRLLREVGDVSP